MINDLQNGRGCTEPQNRLYMEPRNPSLKSDVTRRGRMIGLSAGRAGAGLVVTTRDYPLSGGNAEANGTDTPGHSVLSAGW